MFPKYIVIDKDAREEGANITSHFIAVRQENLDKLLEGLKVAAPGIEFEVKTYEEVKELWQTQCRQEKQKEEDSNK